MHRDDSVFLLSYIVVHNTPASANSHSPFQGYGTSLLGTAAAFLRIASLGFDLRDGPDEIERRLFSRMTGVGARVIPLQLDALAEALQIIPWPFVCVCSAPGIEASVADIIGHSARPVWHVPARSSTSLSDDGEETAGDTSSEPNVEGAKTDASYSALSRTALHDFILSTLDALSGKIPTDFVEMVRGILARQQMSAGADDALRPMRFANSYEHLVTLPNEYVVEALGFRLRKVAPPTLPSTVSLPYEQAIVDGATTILGVRTAVLTDDDSLRSMPNLRKLVPYDVMLAAPAMGRHWYSSAFRGRLRDTDRANAKAISKMLRAFAAQTGYQLQMEEEAFRRAAASTLGRVLVRIRRLELEAFTAVIALRAVADLVPVMRVPWSVNQVHDKAERVCTAARGAGANRVLRLNKFVREMSDSLTRATPSSFLTVVDEAGPGVKLVADAPLEWVRLRQVPLLLRKVVSRIPATPGNLNVMATLPVEEELIPISTLSNVLVLRSFAPNDPIRNDLEMAVNRVRGVLQRNAGQQVEMTFTDVQSEDDIVSALSGFDGPLLVVDCHGAHNRGDEYGSLRIGGRNLDPRQLRGRVRIPPAVVLSACDTHPLDGSHASVAAALLSAGARTVLGTTMPVTSTYAAAFVARLFLRLNEWLPPTLGRPPHMARWSNLVAGLQWRVHMTEVLQVVDGKSGIRLPLALQQSIALTIGMKIEEGVEDWYEEMLRLIAVESTAELQLVREMAAKWATITDALKYIQLGNPESLVVVSDRKLRAAVS